MSEKIYSTLSDFQSGDFENLDRPVVKYNESFDLDLKNFQYVNQFIKHLPYFDKTKKNALQEFEEIKLNLAKALTLNELRPGLVHWTSRLQTYINEFGLFFTKDDHIKLIKIYLQVIATPEIDLVLVEMSFSILIELLKKYYLLKRDDLRIDWRPLYTLYRRIHKIDEKSAIFAPDNIEQISFLNFISFSRIYFDESSVNEMLEEWRPLMCPFDMSMNYAFDRFSLFLPTILLDQGNRLNFWLREFLDLWLNFSGKVYWETNILSLFSRAAKDCVGLFDWTCYIPYIFSKLLRGLGLTMVNSITLNIDDNTPKDSINLINGFINTFSYSDIEIDSIGLWIVSMIGTGSDRNSCMHHIKKLFHILRSYYYPSNDGQLDNFFSLLQRIPEALIERIRFEKLKKYEWLREGRDTESFIQPSDIEELVLCLKDIVLKGLFSKNNFNDAIKTFQYLCFLRADLMLPTLIDQVYESFEINVQPHRYTPLLACLVSVPRELVLYDQSVDTQKHVLHLLISVLPGIDLNDLNKLILTFQFLTNMLSHIIVCDCTPALKIRDDLTDYDKDVCLMTANFVDFIHSLFSRLFTFIDHLASDNSVDVSDTAHQASYYSRVSSTLTDENVTQVHIVQMLNVLVNQSSSQILKVIVDKTFDYLNGRVFNAKSGEIIVYLIGSLVSSSYGRKAFEKFFQYVFENMVCLSKMKNFNSLLKSERCDPSIVWNLHLFSHLLKSNGTILLENMHGIRQFLRIFRPTTNKECISNTTSCYNNLITSLTRIYPIENRSVDYTFAFEDENEFFSEHLPIRDWGKYISPDELKIEYHIPNVQEISAALDITSSVLNESMSFLKKSFLRKNESRDFRSTKEDNYRELNYIYHLVYSSSCLLKRPNSKKNVDEHIDSLVNIAQREELNKGLGFESVNINEQSHEYFSLDDSDKRILLNLRKEVIEFSLKMVDKIIEEKSNDTVMIILLSRILSTSCSVFGSLASDFEKSWKNHFVNKSTIQNKLIEKKYPREELIRRVMLQYEFRCFHLHTTLSDLDYQAVIALTNLSINSFYQVVRDEARTQLFELLSQFQYSILTILPNIVKFLNKTHTDKKISTEQLEGCLLLLKGNSIQTSLLIKQDWYILGKLWPSLFRCKHLENDSIQKLLDNIFSSANLNFNSFNNQICLSDQTVSSAYELCSSTTFATDELRLKLFRQKCTFENQIISELMDDLIDIANDSSACLKSKEISLFSLIFLLDSCKNSPGLLSPQCVQVFAKNLVHEKRNFRRISTDALCMIMKMCKFKKVMSEHKTEEVIVQAQVDTYAPGYRKDNAWNLYNYNFADWQDGKFLDKSYWGYYTWPSRLQIASNHRLTYSEHMDGEYSEAMEQIFLRFKKKNFVKKFLRSSQLEDDKCEKRFDAKKFYLFKSLFRNYGSVEAIESVFEHLFYLVRDTTATECSHKIAAELASGLIRGSKYWPHEELCALWTQLESLFDLIVEHMTKDTIDIWTECFSNSFEDQDPRRMTFYLNYFKNGFVKILNELNVMDVKTKPAFKMTNFMQLLTSLSQFEWRIAEFWNDLIEDIAHLMGHSNKLIREIIYPCAVLSISNEVSFGKNFQSASYGTQNSSSFKNIPKFIERVVQKLNDCIKLYDQIHDQTLSNDARKDIQRLKINQIISNTNFIQTLLNWYILFITKGLEPLNFETLPILSKLLHIDNLISGDSNSKEKLCALRIYLPTWTLDQDCIRTLVEIITQESKSVNWKSRQASIQMVRNFSILNSFILSEEQKCQIKQILLNLIIDENLQVRQSTCLVLGSMLHVDFIKVDSEIINHFIKLTKINIKNKEFGHTSNQSKVIQCHGGILGLCAIVNSTPNEIPDYLPYVITHLCQFCHHIEPINGSVKKCLNEFKRTHLDNWSAHKLKFNSEQLSMLNDTMLSGNYFA